METLVIMKQCFVLSTPSLGCLDARLPLGGLELDGPLSWRGFILTALNAWGPLYLSLFLTQMFSKKYRSIENDGFHRKSLLISVCSSSLW